MVEISPSALCLRQRETGKENQGSNRIQDAAQ
jgi:hypothetical protein